MLSTTLEAALNHQINNEFSSSYLYLSMAAWADSINLSGFAHWMRLQAKEEMEHGMKIFGFVNDRGGRVKLEAIAAPPVEFGSATELIEEVLKHERHITSLIYKVYETAEQEKDYATKVLMHWFIEEQVEEEASVSSILETMKMGGEKGQALIMMDRQLARRGMSH